MINEREKKIFEVTLVGSICNALLVMFKAVAGVVGHSPAMVADAVHSLSDFITDIFVLVFVHISSKPQDSDHPYGHGKYETLATSVVGLSLMLVGLFLMKDSGERIWAVMNGESLAAPGMIALIAAVASIAVKEALYCYTAYYGKKMESDAMIANAWHHRSDSLSSIATMIGIGGAILLGEQWTVLDPIAAILVSVLIIKVAVDVIRQSFDDLVDHSLPEETQQQIIDIISEFADVKDPHNLRTRRIGARSSVDIHIRMDGNLTVFQSHTVTKAIEHRIREILGADAIVYIHVEPDET